MHWGLVVIVTVVMFVVYYFVEFRQSGRSWSTECVQVIRFVEIESDEE